MIPIYITLMPQIIVNYKFTHHISHIAQTTGRYLDIALRLGQYHDIIALTTTTFDAEAVYMELPKGLHCGFELELLSFHFGLVFDMLV